MTVECDGCGVSVEIGATQYAGQPTSWGVDPDDLFAIEWTTDGDDTYCPECSGEDGGEE